MSSPPLKVRFQGRVYQLVDALYGMEAKRAPMKVRQLEGATGRAPTGKLVNRDDWDVGAEGLLSATSTKDDGKPMLVMWNPVTSEIIMSSDRDLDVYHHSKLFTRMRPKLRDYPLSNFRDWVRSSVNQTEKKVVMWPWEPLVEYSMWMQTDGERRHMDALHKKGNPAFERLIASLGSGDYGFSTIQT